MTISLNTALALLPVTPPQGDDDLPGPAGGAALVGGAGLLATLGRVGEAISPLGPAGELGDLLEEAVDCPVPTSHEACEEGVAWQVAAFAETLRHDVACFRMRLAHWEPESRADAVVPPESFRAALPHAQGRGG